jgi:hypothetical protein
MTNPPPILILFSLAVFFCGHAHADFAVDIQHSLTYFHYREFNDTGTRLNKEEGILAGASGFIAYDSGPAEVSISATHLAGKIDYDGQTQGGLAHSTKTSEQLSSIDFMAAYQPATIGWLSFYLNISGHQWTRDIKARLSVSGLEEVYSWCRYALGTAIQFPLSQTDDVDIDIAYGVIRNADVVVKLDRHGFGKPRLALPGRPWLSFGLGLTRRLQQNATVGIDIRYQRFEFGRSENMALNNGTTLITIHEPRSETESLQLALGVSFRL